MKKRLGRLGGGLAGFVCMAAPVIAGFASTETFLPAVGRVAGQGGAQFYTTVWATNLGGAPVSFTFDFLKQGQANTSPASFADTLQPGETKTYENVIESKFGIASAIGAARIVANGEILVSERIYDQPPGADVGNTQGLFFAGVPKSFSISLGQSASIQGINQGGSENFRYNFALVETGGGSPTVSVQLFDGNGTLLGQKAYVMQPYEQLQPNVTDITAAVHTTNARIAATVTGGSGSVLLAGAQLANESQDSSGFEMSFRDQLLGGGGAGVSSLNGLTGALALTAGSGISITPSGTSIQIAATGGGGGGGLTLPLAQSGSAPIGSLFSITNTSAAASGKVNSAIAGIGGAPSGFAGTSLVDPPIGVSGDSQAGTGVAGFSAGYVGTAGFSTGIAGVAGFVQSAVSGIGGYGVAGVSYSSKGTGVFGTQIGGPDSSGDIAGVEGTADKQAGVIGRSTSNYGVAGYSDTGNAIFGQTNGSTSAGVQGENGSNDGFLGGENYGVFGQSQSGNSVWGRTETTGAGNFLAGVYGEATGTGIGVYGDSSHGASNAYAIYGNGANAGVFNGNVNVLGHLTVGGVQRFAAPDPVDASKEIHLGPLTGVESGTYFRGTARIVGGFARIEVPEAFRLVTSADGLTVVATPVGAPAVLFVARQSLDEIVIQGNSDVEFHYVVNGVRRDDAGTSAIVDNENFVPRSAHDSKFMAYADPSVIATLKANGILNADGSINLDTAHRLGWDRRPGWNEPPPEVVPTR